VVNLDASEVEQSLIKQAIDNAYVIVYALGGGINMTTITATEARAQLYALLDKTAVSHDPVQITGKRSNAVLVSEEDWRSIQETLYLVSIPGMRESIRQGIKIPLKKCVKKLDW